MEASKTNLFLVLPANTSGDLWHVAAAQILEASFGDADHFNHNIIIVVACSKYKEHLEAESKVAEAALKENKNLSKEERGKALELTTSFGFQQQEVKYGSASFNYFKNIGLKRVFLEIDIGDAPKPTKLDAALRSLPSTFFDKFWEAQKHLQSEDHSYIEMMNHPTAQVSTELLKNSAQPYEEDGSEPRRVLELMTATTIAMNFLCHQTGDGVDPERYGELGRRMSCGNSKTVDDKVQQEAEAKYRELSDLIAKALHMANPAGQPYQGVLLENYRTNRNNYQTNSNPSLSRFIRDAADSQQLAVVQIPALHDLSILETLKAEKNALILDLYGIEKKLAYPGMEARAQCTFWSMVARDPKVAGIIGGRSGSIDVAAFNGMNAFYWDEPWVHWCAEEPGLTTELGPVNKKVKSTAKPQVPQCLRSLQLLAIMAVGRPTGRVWSNNVKSIVSWSGIGRAELDQWFHNIKNHERNMALKSAIYPPPPTFNSWVLPTSLTSFANSDLEHPKVGITSHILDYIHYRSDLHKNVDADASETEPESGREGES